MNVPRFSSFQRAIAAAIVLTGLLSQVQVVFACDLMEGQRSFSCCCGEQMSDGCALGGGCGLDANPGQLPDCCEVSVETPTDLSVGSLSPTAGYVALQIAPQPPPAALLAAYSESASIFGPVSIAYTRSKPYFVRLDIYLVTNRLRI